MLPTTVPAPWKRMEPKVTLPVEMSCVIGNEPSARSTNAAPVRMART